MAKIQRSLQGWCAPEKKSDDDEGAGRFVGVLFQCPRLSVLELSYNQIVTEGARSVTGVLPQCPEWSKLDLSDNQIGAEGAGRLTGVLTQCLALQTLILYDNEILCLWSFGSKAIRLEMRD